MVKETTPQKLDTPTKFTPETLFSKFKRKTKKGNNYFIIYIYDIFISSVINKVLFYNIKHINISDFV